MRDASRTAAARGAQFLLLVLALSLARATGADEAAATCPGSHGCFSDADLRSLLESSRSAHGTGLIYVWSPHMSYSVRGAKEIGGVARSLGLELTVLLDPVANRKIARAVARRERLDAGVLRILDSRELHARGMLLHLPAFVVYEDGRLIERVYRGYKPRARLMRILEERM